MYVTKSDDPNYQEFTALLGKTGGCAAALLQLATLWGTAALHAGCTEAKLIKLASGIRCPFDSNFIPSCPEALVKVLKGENTDDNSSPTSS